MEEIRETPQEQAEKTGALAALLREKGLEEARAAALLRAALCREEALREKAAQVLQAVEAIGDERFTVEALRAHPEAMRALEEGAGAGEIYRRYFLREESTPDEEEASLGLEGMSAGALTPEEIERISAYVNATGRRVVPS